MKKRLPIIKKQHTKRLLPWLSEKMSPMLFTTPHLTPFCNRNIVSFQISQQFAVPRFLLLLFHETDVRRSPWWAGHQDGPSFGQHAQNQTARVLHNAVLWHAWVAVIWWHRLERGLLKALWHGNDDPRGTCHLHSTSISSQPVAGRERDDHDVKCGTCPS